MHGSGDFARKRGAERGAGAKMPRRQPARRRRYPLFWWLLLFEQAHYAVDGILLLLPILAAGDISGERILQQAAGNSLYVGSEFRIGSRAGDAEGNSHSADRGLHFESKLVRRADGSIAGQDSDSGHGQIDVIGLRALRSILHIGTEVLNG